MLDFDAARQQLMAAAKGLRPAVERIPLAQVSGRVLALPVIAQESVPPQDNSAMDGIAFAFDDVMNGENFGHAALPISAKYFAGVAPEPLQRGTAVRLFTGSVIPAGADTVVLQEDCHFTLSETGELLSVVISEKPKRGQHIRKAGEDVSRGVQILAQGQVLDARHIGLLASCGIAEVDVFKVLKVALLSTGDELVAPGQQLQPGQIYNSNLPLLAAELKALGLQVEARHVLDDLVQIEQQLRNMADSCDVIITIGGVSVGDADLVKTAIERLGRLDLWKVAMKPGKPLSFGVVSGAAGLEVALIGLPGNPVSAFTSFQLFAKSYLQCRMGARDEALAIMRWPIRLPKSLYCKREEFMRVQLQCDEGVWFLCPYPHQGSGVLSSVVWATGLARLPSHCLIENGTEVPYLSFT